MIITLDFITRENIWQIASLVTPKSLFTVTHALFFISPVHSKWRYCSLAQSHQHQLHRWSIYRYLLFDFNCALAQGRDFKLRQEVFMWCDHDLNFDISATSTSADWMLSHKLIELRINKQKTWTWQLIPVMSGHSAHLTACHCQIWSLGCGLLNNFLVRIHFN